MKSVIFFLYGMFVLFCLIFSCIIFSVYFIWGATVDLDLIIANAHMVQTVSLSYYWKEISLSCIVIILGMFFLLRYRKIGVCLVTLMVCGILYYLRPLYTHSQESQEETLYGKNYIIPKVFHGKRQKNIIYVSLEGTTSLWTYEKVIKTKEVLIPNLLKLREENSNFKGWKDVGRMQPTLPSFAATLCGVTSPPISFSALKEMWKNKDYGGFTKATCISDIFKKNGYKTIYIMGGKIEDERADNLTSNHSFENVYGKNELKKLGYSGIGAANYYVPDSILFQFAKDELSKIPKDEHFFLSIILGNTHGPDVGYTEPFCDEHYNRDIRDAYRCEDKVIFDFVNWCKKQPFFENTVIFLVGDHLPWSKIIEKNGLDYDARKQYPKEETYNAVIDGTNTITKIQKDFSQVDYAPTILESAGFVLVPRAFGLGVSLYDDSPTLVQKIGIKKFRKELEKDRNYWPLLYGADSFN